jgi:trans-2-enoyl-CoA reductase
MSSKGAKYTTKCIEVPVFVLNIALLYAFLITVSHLLAWVTIARHEGTIEELKEILLRRIENEEKQPLTSDQTLRGDDGENTVVQESDVLKVCFLCFRFHFVVTAMTSPTLLTVVQPM